jgi:hypothetical protein
MVNARWRSSSLIVLLKQKKKMFILSSLILSLIITLPHHPSEAAAVPDPSFSGSGTGGHLLPVPDFDYHSEHWLTNYLNYVVATYPTITDLYSIGKSFRGRNLTVIVIGESSREHVPLRPDVKYVGNIHGNEVVSRELLIHLIHYLVTNYQRNETVTRLLRTTRIHILVAMNPDGYAIADNYSRGDCMGVRGRYNANGYDLNRNFPDYFVTNPAELQVETKAIMDWLNRYQFVLSGTLHGGTMVANYPYDNLPKGMQFPSYARSSDDDVFVHLARTYSYNHRTMHLAQRCPWDQDHFPEGIVNGASWYLVTGSMQDYNYIFGGCMELTLEISCCKFPSHTELEAFWNDNKNALITLLTQVHLGVKGVVVDRSGAPIANASVRVLDRLHGAKTTAHGEFWRILLPGNYTIEVTAPTYRAVSYNFQLTSKTARATGNYIGHPNVLREDVPVWPTHSQNVAVLKVTLDDVNDDLPQGDEVIDGENLELNLAVSIITSRQCHFAVVAIVNVFALFVSYC